MLVQRLSIENAADIMCEDKNASWHRNHEACLALAKYLDEFSNELGINTEIDFVLLRSNFSLYKDLAQFNEETGEECVTLDDAENLTTVIDVDGTSFIALSF